MNVKVGWNGVLLLLLVPFVSALTDDEVNLFHRGDGYNKTVVITEDSGKLTFTTYKRCDHDRMGENCTDRELSLTVNSPAVAIQPPAEPSQLPAMRVIGFGLDGHPIFHGRCMWRGRSRGRHGGRGGGRGGKGRGRGGRGRGRGGKGRGRGGKGPRRGGSRGKRHAERLEREDHEERKAMLVAQDQLLGVALDGYPIYSANSSEVSDRLLQTSDLDQCGGRCNADGRYSYHAVHVGDDDDDDDDDDDVRVMIHFGCIKGEVVDAALVGFEEERRMEDRYNIACDANSTVGSCVSSASVNETSYECVDGCDDRFDRSDNSGSSESESSESSESSDESDSSEESDSSDRRSRGNGRRRGPSNRRGGGRRA